MNIEKHTAKKADFEYYYPIIFSIILAIITTWLFIKYPIELGREIESVINNLIVFVSIIIGFLGVLLGVLLSLKNEKIIVLLFELREKDVLKHYFITPLISGSVSVLLGCVLFFRKIIDDCTNDIYGNLSVSECSVIIWLFLLSITIFSSYRLVDIMFELIFSKKVQERKYINESEEKAKELENRYSE